MRILAMAILLALAGCESESRACAYACAHANGKRMLRYSPSEGCVCEDGERKQ